MDDLWLRDRLEELAGEVGNLSWRLRGNEHQWLLERLQARVDMLLISVTPTAADLVRNGYTVDGALRIADEERDRMYDVLGIRPR